MKRLLGLTLVTSVVAVAACGGDDDPADAGPADAGTIDAVVSDADPADASPPDAVPVSPYFGEVIFNEVLADGTSNEDANGDGTIDAMEDEFVEIVNISGATIDVSGWTLVETDWNVFLPRHTFAASTGLGVDGAAVVFGGGDPPSSTATVLYLPSNAQDPGTAYGLDLDNDGERISLLDGDGLLVDVFTYGDEGGIAATSDESMTRDPDLTGAFVAHSSASGAAAAIFSPGTRVDGTAF
jgi:hypothetical protein